MTSLSEVIRFRASVHKLTDTEFHQFILTLVQKCGRDILITSLFTMFTSGCDRSSQSLETTLNIIKQIIESRKTKPKPASSSDITMQSLPSALIGNLASYLNFTDYCAFSQANRTVYLGCNTPNTLYRLDLSTINDYSEINLAKYSHLRDLSLNLNAFDSFVLPTNGRTVCNRLQAVRLDAGKRTDVNNVNIAHFISQNTINTNNVTHLRCEEFGNDEEQNHFPFDAFTDLLSQFSNIQDLDLVGVVLQDLPSVRRYHAQSDLLQLMPHLQRFTWITSRPHAFLGEILTTFHSKLKALKVLDLFVEPLPTHITFSSLEELFIVIDRSLSTVNQILNTTKNLRKVLFIIYNINYSVINTCIQQLLTTQPLLEYIGIFCDYGMFDDICNAIESGLNNMEHKNKNIRMVLFIQTEEDEVIDITKFKNILFMIAKIVHQLRLLDPQNFMLMFAFKEFYVDDWVKAYTDFKQKHSDLSVYRGASLNTYFNTCIVIGNHTSIEDMIQLCSLFSV
eukprot:885006_1